jgi:pyrroline-5-carboxylate reductase
MAKLLLVGCGKMGGALLSGWLSKGIAPEDVLVAEPGSLTLPSSVRVIADATQTPDSFRPDIVVLAVKPQLMDAILPNLSRFAGSAGFLSIAAGRTLGSLAAGLGVPAPIVRAMPNLPASVGRGFSVAVSNARVSAGQRALCDDLLKAVGEVEWVDDEALIDAVTAVSGSGPAYVFLLVEVLGRAGAAAGLPDGLAQRMARATVAGSGELLRLSELSATALREAVTSPGGTTFAALQVLMGDHGLAPLIERAVGAAKQRSRELAQ